MLILSKGYRQVTYIQNKIGKPTPIGASIRTTYSLNMSATKVAHLLKIGGFLVREQEPKALYIIRIGRGVYALLR